MASVFHYVPQIEEKNKKIRAMTFIGDNLVAGDSHGNLYHYYDILQMMNKGGAPPEKADKRISSKGVRKIAALPTIKTLLVLTEDLLLNMVSIPDFKIIQKIDEHVENMAVHPYNDEVYIVKKNFSLLLYKMEEKTLRLVLQKGTEMQLLRIPHIIEWGGSHGEYLYLGDEKEYTLIDTKEGKPSALQVAPAKLPFLKISKSHKPSSHNPFASVPVKWHALVKDNFLVELSETNPQQGVYELPKDGVVVGVEQRGIYLVCVLSDQILVFNKQKEKLQAPIQVIKVEEGYEYKCIVDSGKESLFVLMTTDASRKEKKTSEVHSQIMRLDQTPYILQMEGMLIKGEVEDARNMLSRYLKVEDKERAKKFYDFNLDAGWSLFKSLAFEESQVYFSESGLDIRELLLFFKELVPHTKAPNSQVQLFYKNVGLGELEPDIPKIKSLIVQHAKEYPEKGKIDVPSKESEAYTALFDILIAKRESILFQHAETIQRRQEGEFTEEVKLMFKTSKHSAANTLMNTKTPISLDEYLNLIDESIIKLMVASPDFKLRKLTHFFKKYGGVGRQQKHEEEAKIPAFSSPPTSSDSPPRALYFNQRRLLYYLHNLESRHPDTIIAIKAGVAQALVLEFAGEDAEAVVRWQKLGLLARKSQEPYVRLNEGDAPTKPSRELAFPGDALHNTRSLNQEVMELGIEKTIKLLQRAGKRDLLLKHCRWIVEVNPKDSMRVFDNPRETYDLTYDDILRKLEEVGSSNEEKLNLRIQYLERLVYSEGIASQATPNTDIQGFSTIPEETEKLEGRFYTLLAISYADRLYMFKGKEMPRTTNRHLLAANKDMLDLQEKFRNFLISFDKYQASVVLDKIKGTEWMVEEEITLLGREHKHRQVLEKYITAGEIMKAEVHCERHLDEPGLMNDFFDLLIANYETQNERLRKSKEQRQTTEIGTLKNKVNDCKHDILEYLDKHNFSFILEKLPEDWQLQHDDDSSGTQGIASSYVSFTLLPFLKNAFKCKIQQNQELKIKKGLTKMELINAHKERVLRQRPSYHLSDQTKCCVCNKKVGLKLFSVYPNGNIVHTQRCMKDPHICPKTGTNFKFNF